MVTRPSSADAAWMQKNAGWKRIKTWQNGTNNNKNDNASR